MDQGKLLEIVAKIAGYAAKQILKAQRNFQQNKIQEYKINNDCLKNKKSEINHQKSAEKIPIQKLNEEIMKLYLNLDSDQESDSSSKKINKKKDNKIKKEGQKRNESQFQAFINCVPTEKFSKQYKCRYCQKQYSHRSTRYVHERKIHKEQKQIVELK